eukprot:108586_1
MATITFTINQYASYVVEKYNGVSDDYNNILAAYQDFAQGFVSDDSESSDVKEQIDWLFEFEFNLKERIAALQPSLDSLQVQPLAPPQQTDPQTILNFNHAPPSQQPDLFDPQQLFIPPPQYTHRNPFSFDTFPTFEIGTNNNNEWSSQNDLQHHLLGNIRHLANNTSNIELNVHLHNHTHQIHHQEVNTQYVERQYINNQSNENLYDGVCKYNRIRIRCIHPSHDRPVEFYVVSTGNIFDIACLRIHGHGQAHREHASGSSFEYMCNNCFKSPSRDTSKYYWDEDAPGDNADFIGHLSSVHRKRVTTNDDQEEEKEGTRMV